MKKLETLDTVYIYIVSFNKITNKHRKAMYFRRI